MIKRLVTVRTVEAVIDILGGLERFQTEKSDNDDVLNLNVDREDDAGHKVLRLDDEVYKENDCVLIADWFLSSCYSIFIIHSL